MMLKLSLVVGNDHCLIVTSIKKEITHYVMYMFTNNATILI